jgi:hypothetical protein
MRLSHRLGSATVEVASPAGGVLVSHRLAPAGAGALVRTVADRAELERVVLSAFTAERPCERKANRPPGTDARTEAAKLLSGLGSDVVIDLARYGELADTSTASVATGATTTSTPNHRWTASSSPSWAPCGS